MPAASLHDCANMTAVLNLCEQRNQGCLQLQFMTAANMPAVLNFKLDCAQITPTAHEYLHIVYMYIYCIS